jgi:hypothetical protein
MAKKQLSEKFIILTLLGLVVIIAIVGLMVTLKGEKTGEAVYTAPLLCPSGYTSHSSDSPLLEAKAKAGETCVKSAYPGWYCCPTIMK